MILFSDGDTTRAAAGGLTAVTTSLSAGVAQIQAAGAAVAPPGAEGASMVAAVQQKESLQLFAASLIEGLGNIATGVPLTTTAASTFEMEDAMSALAISTF